MSRTRLVIVCVVAFFVLLLVAREVGAVRLNLYSSQSSSSRTGSHTVGYNGEKQTLSYDIRLTRDGREWMAHRRIILGSPRVSIEGELGGIEYSGLDWTPLWKSFSMSYVCEFETVDSDGPARIAGKVEGSVEYRIVGLCSRREARRLALETAKQKVGDYIKSMNPGRGEE
jgi:hypothetical protein